MELDKGPGKNPLRIFALFALLCPNLIAGCEGLTQRAQRFAEGSSSLRFSALSLRLGVKNGAFSCGFATPRPGCKTEFFRSE